MITGSYLVLNVYACVCICVSDMAHTVYNLYKKRLPSTVYHVHCCDLNLFCYCCICSSKPSDQMYSNYDHPHVFTCIAFLEACFLPYSHASAYIIHIFIMLSHSWIIPVNQTDEKNTTRCYYFNTVVSNKPFELL